MFDSTQILGFNIHHVTMFDLLEAIKGFVKSRKAHKVVLLNPYIMLEAIKHQDYKSYIESADMVTADGVGLLIAAKWLNKPFPERVTGTDLMPNIARLAEQEGYRLYLFGAKPGVVDKAADNIRKSFPGICIAGTRHGYFNEEEEKNIVQDIINKKTDILIVCLGAYKQEMFIERNFEKMNVPVCFGNGAALDFVSGRVMRAPRWMQNLGLEWFFRLLQEPRRLWKRYLIGNTVFLILVLKEYLRKKYKKAEVSTPPQTIE